MKLKIKYWIIKDNIGRLLWTIRFYKIKKIPFYKWELKLGERLIDLIKELWEKNLY